ncbi:MAG: hypothetical protein IV298_00090 [Cylindrospermopsis raciborskii KL1]|nr:hypothetical protein [Cylindrospermopsis raciborskii]MBG0741881.1 hypothetical protein [Cylindrospermopsis raciborskii KL1]
MSKWTNYHYYYLTIASECYQDAVKNISKEYDAQLPSHFPFGEDVDKL